MRKCKLKIWNGRGHGLIYGRDGHMFVAAYSEKQAAELLTMACKIKITVNEIRIYYNKNCWGNPMDGIEPTEPCVYGQIDYYRKPTRLV